MLMVLLGQLIRGMRGLLHFRWSIFKGVEIVESRLANLSRIGGPIILPSFGCRVAGLHAMSRDDEMASLGNAPACHNTSGQKGAQCKLGMNKGPPWKRNVSDEGVGALLMIFNSVCSRNCIPPHRLYPLLTQSSVEVLGSRVHPQV